MDLSRVYLCVDLSRSENSPVIVHRVPSFSLPPPTPRAHVLLSARARVRDDALIRALSARYMFAVGRFKNTVLCRLCRGERAESQSSAHAALRWTRAQRGVCVCVYSVYRYMAGNERASARSFSHFKYNGV